MSQVYIFSCFEWQDVVEVIEKEWLGPWRCLLRAQCSDSEFQKTKLRQKTYIEEHIRKILGSDHQIDIEVLVISVFLVVISVFCINSNSMKEFIYKIRFRKKVFVLLTKWHDLSSTNVLS